MAVEKEMPLKLGFVQYFQSFPFPCRELLEGAQPRTGLSGFAEDKGLFKEKSAKRWGRQRFTGRDDRSPT